MKTKIKFTLIMLTLFFAVSCNNDDDNGPMAVYNNQVVIAGSVTDTPNAYAIFDDNPGPYNDAFFIVLTNGSLVEDNINGISTTTDTHIAVALVVDNGGQVNTENQINFNVATYPLEKDNTVVVENITLFTGTYIDNGVTYGEIDEDSAVSYGIENSGAGTLEIISITKDFSARTGTITCEYSITDDNGVIITGDYQGNFEMLNGF